MSEFSESYHLKSERLEDAVELLQRADLKGYVYPPANGWVTFLAEGVYTSQQSVVAANQSLLLYYANAPDHGWNFAIFEADNCVGSYNRQWGDGVEWDESNNLLNVIQRVVAPHVAPETIEALLHSSSIERVVFDSPAYHFAELVSLTHYRWLSYSYAEQDIADGSERYAEVTAVE